jgi:hypothetical protein
MNFIEMVGKYLERKGYAYESCRVADAIRVRLTRNGTVIEALGSEHIAALKACLRRTSYDYLREALMLVASRRS